MVHSSSMLPVAVEVLLSDASCFVSSGYFAIPWYSSTCGQVKSKQVLDVLTIRTYHGIRPSVRTYVRYIHTPRSSIATMQ